MKVDLTILTFILTFGLSCIILFLSKPTWVQVADDESKLVISWPFIVVYSLIFASLMAIIVLVTIELDRESKDKKISNKPKSEISTKFCGMDTY